MFRHKMNGVITHTDLKDSSEKAIYSDIAKLIAFHKDELLTNIKSLHYKLQDESDVSIVNFVLLKSADKNVADMLASMIYKYKTPLSNASGIWGGISNVITDVFSQKEKTQQQSEQAKQAAMLAEIEKQKTEQEKIKALSLQKAKLSKATWLLVGGATALILVVILYVSRKNKINNITNNIAS